jgi:hypothetical protein
MRKTSYENGFETAVQLEKLAERAKVYQSSKHDYVEFLQGVRDNSNDEVLDLLKHIVLGLHS